jgi:hypothetical protein
LANEYRDVLRTPIRAGLQRRPGSHIRAPLSVVYGKSRRDIIFIDDRAAGFLFAEFYRSYFISSGAELLTEKSNIGGYSWNAVQLFPRMRVRLNEPTGTHGLARPVLENSASRHLAVAPSNVEIGWLWDGGIDLRLGDKMNGYLAEENVSSVAEILPWFQEAIAHFYPDSAYSQSLDAEVKEHAACRVFMPPRLGATVRCPHCGAPNSAPGMDEVFAFYCSPVPVQLPGPSPTPLPSFEVGLELSNSPPDSSADHIEQRHVAPIIGVDKAFSERS